jgi:hypothetical protein|tara:strand:+ start:681 stop:911 length:231 start_codon:yes stop_codon:yes gene_type:complete
MDYSNFQNLLNDLKTSVNNEVFKISRKINGNWEKISLSNYKNSEDLIFVQTQKLAFTVTRWDPNFTIGQQITEFTK